MPICRFQRFSVREAREVAATFVPVSVADMVVGCFFHAQRLMEEGIQILSNVYYIYIYIYICIYYMYIIIFLTYVLYMYIQFESNEILKKTSICAWKC